MLITINVTEARGCDNRIIAAVAEAEAEVPASARSGYDAATLARLEAELEELVNRRLNEALIAGGGGNG